MSIRYPSIVIVLSIFLISLLLFSNVVFAMGTNPSTCHNRFDGKIASMIIDNGLQKIDIRSHNGTTFHAELEKGYKIILVLEPLVSSSNTDDGSLWYTNTAYGFSAGTCIDAFAANNKTISIDNIVMGQATSGTIQKVTWGSWPDAVQVTYNVHWQP